MLETLGAPVTDALGKSERITSDTGASVRASTVEVICHNVGNRDSAHSSETATEPGFAIRPRSFLTMSAIMTFSARFLAERASHAARSRSCASVIPRLTVPFIGSQRIAVPIQSKK